MYSRSIRVTGHPISSSRWHRSVISVDELFRAHLHALDRIYCLQHILMNSHYNYSAFMMQPRVTQAFEVQSTFTRPHTIQDHYLTQIQNLWCCVVYPTFDGTDQLFQSMSSFERILVFCMVSTKLMNSLMIYSAFSHDPRVIQAFAQISDFEHLLHPRPRQGMYKASWDYLLMSSFFKLRGYFITSQLEVV